MFAAVPWEPIGIVAATLLGVANSAWLVFTWRQERQGRRHAALRLSIGPRTAPRGGSIHTYLVIHNDGPAVARNVTVKPVAARGAGKALELTTEGSVHLGPHEEFPILALVDMTMGALQEVTLRWDDDAGVGNEELRLLSLEG